MLLIDLLSVLYEETSIEICIDYEPVYIGTVEGVPKEKFVASIVKEVYIELGGSKLIISVFGQRNVKKK